MVKQMVWQGKRYPLSEDNIVLMRDEGLLWVNLPLYLNEVNHSPTGFEWGYFGSGPIQLSYAILRSYFELAARLGPQMAKAMALEYYYEFGDSYVSKWSTEWKITSKEIETWLWEAKS